jgi:hypothetical protein
MPSKCARHGRTVFARKLHQHDKAGVPLHQGGDLSSGRSTQQVAFPMAGDSAIFGLRGSLANRDGIGDLASARAELAAMVTAVAHGAPAAQVRNELRLQHSACLDEQRAVDRFMRHALTVIAAKLPGKPGRDLLRRPVQAQLSSDQEGQRWLLRQAAGLGTLRASPSLPIRSEGSIAGLAAVAGNLLADARGRPSHPSRHCSNGIASADPPRDLLALAQRKRAGGAAAQLRHTPAVSEQPVQGPRTRPQRSGNVGAVLTVSPAAFLASTATPSATVNSDSAARCHGASRP